MGLDTNMAQVSSSQESDTARLRLRSYQTEMVEKSLQGNIIVAMDTGSGKTHIAISRAQAELETCDPHKIVWFMAPTVALCNQQHGMFETHLPAYQTRLLTGAENVDTWTEQRTWDAVLSNIRIVVSTPDVLADALTHGFVSMSKLALLVFDEAHHCTKSHGTNKIMRDFYHRLRVKDPSSVPPVLGLTASPVINADPNALQTIERNLNSQVVIPKVHRTEFLQHVHRPLVEPLVYIHDPLAKQRFRSSTILVALQNGFHGYDLDADPYIQNVLERSTHDLNASLELQKAYMKNSTYCLDQLKYLNSRALSICEQLGTFASERYFRDCVRRLSNSLSLEELPQIVEWTQQEKVHLLNLLQIIAATPTTSVATRDLSPKMTALVDYLKQEYHENFKCLIFAEQRAVVAALAETIRDDPRLGSLFNVGAFVGTSSFANRQKSLAELVDLRGQDQDLQEFRDGRKNLLIATSVLEEGIDVPDCNVVICFDRPTNLKMYVQRRGRARKENSRFVIALPDNSEDLSSSQWSTLEEILKDQYTDESRQIKVPEATELIDETDDYNLYVESTKALLTSDGAVGHLHHFCATLSTGPYADHRPEFEFTKDKEGLISAEVTLPLAVDATLRHHSSKSKWKTEIAARKDAAFQAYKALRTAGLINDNLLPLHNEGNDAPDFNAADQGPSMVSVSLRINPWRLHMPTDNRRYLHRIVFTSDTGHVHKLDVMTTVPLPGVPKYSLYWNEQQVYEVSHESMVIKHLDDTLAESLQRVTYHLLSAAFGAQRLAKEQYDFVALLIPDVELSAAAIDEFISTTAGALPATILANPETMTENTNHLGLIKHNNERFILKDVEGRKVDSAERTSKYVLKVNKFPKRKDFLHPSTGQEKQNPAYTTIQELDISESFIETMPAEIVTAVTFIPCVLHRLEIYMVAEQLCSGLLAPLEFNEPHLVLTALITTSAREHVNYQRMEFLGDCMLKFCSSIRLMARNPTWPESFLTAEKGRTVSNYYLAKASLQAGLDQFIIRTAFTGIKWRPLYMAEQQEELRQVDPLSTKTLADVVESLIGASFLLRHQLSDALTCMQILMPKEPWLSIYEANQMLSSKAPDTTLTSSYFLEPVESMVGHSFELKSLLVEALTHPSYNSPHRHEPVASYNRLEFLGDAVIDYIISTKLYAHDPPLPHYMMHRYRTALVNAYILAFLAFELEIAESRYDIPKPAKRKLHPIVEPEVRDFRRSLHHFLRHSSPSLQYARESAHARHSSLRHTILEALRNGDEYPWVHLEQARADKVFSDIVESTIGAIYIDTHGSFEACETFLDNLGVLKVLKRMLRGEIDCLHPKERLGQMAVNDKVYYVHVKKQDVISAENAQCPVETSATKTSTQSYVCRVRVGDRDIGDDVEGILRSDTETLAAWRACQVMSAQVPADHINLDEQEL